MPIYKLLEPAIRLARDGFPAYERLITALNVAKKSETFPQSLKQSLCQMTSFQKLDNS